MHRFLKGRNPALSRLVTDLPDVLLGRKPGGFVTTATAWWVLDKLVLLGDAAHAQPAYVGQGVNAALADGAALMTCLDQHGGDISRALEAYQRRRARHAAGLGDFSERHGRLLLGGTFGNWRWRLSDRVARLRERLFGRRSLYQRLVFDCEELA